KLTAVTDENGAFTIRVPQEPGVLEFSFIGTKPHSATFEGAGQFDITLQAENKALDEIIIVGHGSQKQGYLTRPVGRVSSEVLVNRPITTLAQGLQGTVPNLSLTPADGKPNGSPAFNIRGATSIGQGGNALVLIDGVEGDPALL